MQRKKDLWKTKRDTIRISGFIPAKTDKRTKQRRGMASGSLLGSEGAPKTYERVRQALQLCSGKADSRDEGPTDAASGPDGRHIQGSGLRINKRKFDGRAS